jgi:hypothetical protein
MSALQDWRVTLNVLGQNFDESHHIRGKRVLAKIKKEVF